MLPHGVVLLPSPDRIVFGYGDHPSTRRCLDAIARWDLNGATFADVGAGTGLLGIRAALNGAQVTCYEQDETLHDLIRANAEANGVSIEVRGVYDGEHHDFAVANIGEPIDLNAEQSYVEAGDAEGP